MCGPLRIPAYYALARMRAILNLNLNVEVAWMCALAVTKAKTSVACGEYCANGKCVFTMDYL